MTTPKVSAADLDLLRRYDTPTVCNVIELFDLHPRTAGYMDRRIQACYPKLPPMVGFASTATFRSAASAWGGGAYSGLVEQVESFARMPGPPGGRLSGHRQSAGVGDLRRSDVQHLQGVRRRRPHHQRRRPRSRSGRAAALPLLQRRHDFAPRLLSLPADQRAGPRRRRDGLSRRSAARRSQRRDVDPAGGRLARRPCAAPSTWPPSQWCSIISRRSASIPRAMPRRATSARSASTRWRDD